MGNAWSRFGSAGYTTLFLLATSPPSVGAQQQGQAERTAWGKELDLTVSQILETHPEPFAIRTRAGWDAEVADLRLSIPELADHEIVVRLMQLVASLRDGHTRYDSENGSHGFERLFPVIVYPFADGMHVIAAIQEYAHLVGARVLRYGAVEPEEALARVATTIGADNVSGELREVPYALQRPAILHALGITPQMGTLEVTLRTVSGETVEPKLEAIPREDDRFERDALVFANDTTTASLPLYLEHAPTRFHWLKHPQPRFFWHVVLESPRVLYAQINRVRDAPDGSFAGFCKDVFDALDREELGTLVLDLRHCPGGNNTLLRPMIHGIIRRDALLRRGGLFVITGRHTFSAAVNLVTRIEGETRGQDGSSMILVGEAPAGAPNHFGDSKIFYHYQTDLTLIVSEYRWQDSVPWDQRRSITPDLSAPLRSTDYRDRLDPALEAITKYLETRR